LLAVLLTVSTAIAGWQETFSSNFQEKDLNSAVTNALAQGIAPEEIIKTAMALGVDSKTLTEALCGAGVAVYALPESLEILKLNQQTAKDLCQDISATVRFPGSGYSSASKRTNYDGSNNRPLPPPDSSGSQPRLPASGHNFR